MKGALSETRLLGNIKTSFTRAREATTTTTTTTTTRVKNDDDDDDDDDDDGDDRDGGCATRTQRENGTW